MPFFRGEIKETSDTKQTGLIWFSFITLVWPHSVPNSANAIIGSLYGTLSPRLNREGDAFLVFLLQKDPINSTPKFRSEKKYMACKARRKTKQMFSFSPDIKLLSHTE